MITKFKTVPWSVRKIEEVTIERETESSVWINGRRVAKISENGGYFDTWVEAHSFLLARAEGKLERARANLQIAQGEYGNVKGMKPE